MKVFWWQAGLHIEPENENDLDKLLTLEYLLVKLGVSGRVVSEVSVAVPPQISATKTDINSSGNDVSASRFTT